MCASCMLSVKTDMCKDITGISWQPATYALKSPGEFNNYVHSYSKYIKSHFMQISIRIFLLATILKVNS